MRSRIGQYLRERERPVCELIQSVKRKCAYDMLGYIWKHNSKVARHIYTYIQSENAAGSHMNTYICMIERQQR